MSTLSPLIQRCLASTPLHPTTLTPSSSSSSSSFILTSSSGEKYLAKTGRNVAQMRGESASLLAMGRTAPTGLVSSIVGFVEEDRGKGEAGMVCDWFELKRGVDQKKLGEMVAAMHSVKRWGEDGGDLEKGVEGVDQGEVGWEGMEGPKGKFGFHVPTHCGVTEQDNTWEDNWEAFFRDRRLGDLVQRIGDAEIRRAWEEMKEVAIPMLLTINPRPEPVILHGDLWSGNVGTDSRSGSPVIYDPSSYYGHNEADLGITHMFGGFTKEFYEAYHTIHPRCEPYYDERQKLYELYHHLNHTLMFGGSYRSGALGIMRELISWAASVDS